MCPKGNDVMDERNNLDQALKYQTQTVTLIGAGAAGDGVAKDGATVCGAASDETITDACFADLFDKSFALTFTSKLNQSYTTKPIIVTAIATASVQGLYDLGAISAATRDDLLAIGAGV